MPCQPGCWSLRYVASSVRCIGFGWLQQLANQERVYRDFEELE
ncbi:MAG: hypothetical protein N838_16820 [Thiohalocapsa sp. PB-PSB1]|nr:MAG: hypothetical protein N838_16820 [Thiohalocapsa sp. PB-PSB1]